MAGAFAVLMAAGCAGGSDTDERASQIDADVSAYWETFDRAGLVRAVLVNHRGEPVLQRYTGATSEDHFDSHSVTKSVVSALVGIAIEQGHIDGVDQTLAELLPAYAPDMTPVVAEITLRQLLTHTAGFTNTWAGAPGPPFWESENYVRNILTNFAPAEAPDGEFRYSDPGTHLLSAILVQATGQTVLDYARANLFDPLGIRAEPAWEAPPGGPPPATSLDEFFDSYYASDFAWPIDPQGHQSGWGLLKIRPEDLARIGQLYLDAGRWDGDQVIPASWVDQSTTEQTDTAHLSDTSGYPADAYGYLWWITEVDDDPAYFAWGYGGQLIAVIPDRDLVVVLTTDFDERDDAAAAIAPAPLTALNMVTTAIAPHFEAS